MNTIGTAEMRTLERRAMASGEPERLLMERAGVGAAAVLECLFFQRHVPFFAVHPKKTAILIGPGNNGGDGIVAARELARRGIAVTLFSAKSQKDLAESCGGSFLPELPDSVVFEHTSCVANERLAEFPVVVDALFGTGFHGEVRSPYASWIDAVNASSAAVVSLDLPSGVNADTGECAAHAVLADVTLTFGAPKHGLFRGKGDLLSGMIELIPIGTDAPEAVPSSVSMLSREEAGAFLPRIVHDSHKNSRGGVLLICGSKEYPGATGLAASGCAAGGAGLIRLFYEALPQGGLANSFLIKEEHFDRNLLIRNREWMDKSDVVVAGCGWGMRSDRTALLESLARSGKKIVLDADALNTLAAAPFLWQTGGTFLLTPHPGEARRLCRAFDIPWSENRQETAQALAQRLGTIVLLKGNHTVIAAPDGRIAVNPSGCGALAKAGSGDVLSGLCGAMLLHHAPFDAARAAAYFHGRAGELAPCARSLTADKLPQYIAESMQEHSLFA